MEKILKDIEIKIDNLTRIIGRLDHDLITCKKLEYQSEENALYIKLSYLREERNNLTEIQRRLIELTKS